MKKSDMYCRTRQVCTICVWAQCLARQPFELVQVLGEEDRTQIADVEPSARSPHDQILFRQPAHAASLVRGQRNPQQIETARKVEKGKQLVAGKIRFGNAMLERVLREGGPELGFFGGIILQFLLEAADPDKFLAAEAHRGVAGSRNLEEDDRLFFVGPFRLQFPTPCTPFRARAVPPSSTRPTDTRRSSPDRSCCASTRPIPFPEANREARPTEMTAGVGSFVAIIAICRYAAPAELVPPCDEILRGEPEVRTVSWGNGS